ncbi:hypothetical protein NHQ30_008249 [Ciborinia camelliae]|nr:hypothetical protein NHQ30_008249 [Ciborinia camelliae]
MALRDTAPGVLMPFVDSRPKSRCTSEIQGSSRGDCACSNSMSLEKLGGRMLKIAISRNMFTADESDVGNGL